MKDKNKLYRLDEHIITIFWHVILNPLKLYAYVGNQQRSENIDGDDTISKFHLILAI